MRIFKGSRCHWQRELFFSPLIGFGLLLSVLVPGLETEAKVPGVSQPSMAAPVRPLSPEEAEVLQKAAGEFQRGEYAACLKILESGAGAIPHPETLNLRGAALSELGRQKEAVAMFEWALQGDPSHFWARYNLAEIALLDGNLPLARKHFLAINPQGPSQKELLSLKLLLIDLRSGDEASARRQLPPWPPASAAGCAAYAAMAHSAGDDAKRAALLAEARRAHPEQWDLFLRKTLQESGIPVD